MPITEQQRLDRKNHLGSSDMAAVLGVDPWRTAFDVWAEKTDRVGDMNIDDKPAVQAGNVFENGVLDFAEGLLGHLDRNVYRELAGSPLAANIDAIVDDPLVANSPLEPVEAKTVGLFHRTDEWWGDCGTDQVPDRVIIQSHVHMICTVRWVCHVAAFIGGRGFVMYQVRHSERVADIIIRKADTFWRDNVQADTPPDGSRASLQIVKAMKRKAESVANVDPELVATWQKAVEAKSAARKAEEAAKLDVLNALGEAEAGLCGTHGAVTYFETHRKGYEVKPSTYRTLRLRKEGLER